LPPQPNQKGPGGNTGAFCFWCQPDRCLDELGPWLERKPGDVAPERALGLNWTPSKGDGDEEEPFTEDQIIGVLKEHQAGIPTAELCRKHGISDATFYNWRSRYGGMEVSDVRRLKSLEDENRRLKKLLAESMLDVATLKEALGKF